MSSPAGSPDLPSGSPRDAVEVSLGARTTRPGIPLPRWLAPLAISCTVLLIPWIVYLAMTLPRRDRAVHYDVAWVGFDIGMWLVLVALAYCSVARKPYISAVASAAATMLMVDAWFDVVTTARRPQLAMAIGSATFIEVPLAVICAWVAVNAERIRTRAFRRLSMRWESTSAQLARGPASGQARPGSDSLVTGRTDRPETR